MNILRVPKKFAVRSRTMRLMLYTLFGVIVADALITKFLVTNGHASELNPLLQAWVDHEMFFAIKISGAFLVTLFLWVKFNAKPRLIYGFTSVCLAFYTSIVSWNLSVFLITQY